MPTLTKEEQVELNKYLEELIGKYVEYKNQENNFKTSCKEISDEIDGILHHIKENSISVYIAAIDQMYEAKYIDRKTKKVDYVRLAEIISDEMYDDVVRENETTYLKIGPAAVKKSTKREKPVKETNKFKLPTGTIQ